MIFMLLHNYCSNICHPLQVFLNGFADNVNSRGELYTFIWDGSEETAKLIQSKTNEKIRFQWQTGSSDDDKYFFEFLLQVDEITKDVSLIISDFSKKEELDESKMLWNTLIQDLKHVLGSS